MRSASPCCPDWYCASASSAQRRSRSGAARTSACASASTSRCRPPRSCASTRSSSASRRSSSRRRPRRAAGGQSSRSAKAAPRHSASASSAGTRPGRPRRGPAARAPGRPGARTAGQSTSSAGRCSGSRAVTSRSPRAQRLAQPDHAALQDLLGRGRRLVAPERVDELVGAHRMPGAGRQRARTTRSRRPRCPEPSTVSGPSTVIPTRSESHRALAPSTRAIPPRYRSRPLRYPLMSQRRPHGVDQPHHPQGDHEHHQHPPHGDHPRRCRQGAGALTIMSVSCAHDRQRAPSRPRPALRRKRRRRRGIELGVDGHRRDRHDVEGVEGDVPGRPPEPGQRLLPR